MPPYLLDSKQQKALAEIARREGRSISDLSREFLQQGIDQRQQQYQKEIGWRLEALENARRVRNVILQEEWGCRMLDVDLAELINQIREDRDAEILSRSN